MARKISTEGSNPKRKFAQFQPDYPRVGKHTTIDEREKKRPSVASPGFHASIPLGGGIIESHHTLEPPLYENSLPSIVKVKQLCHASRSVITVR